MNLGELLTDSVKLEPRMAAIEVRGLTADSRAVQRGDVFVAMGGGNSDGHEFVAQAIAQGIRAYLEGGAP